MADPRPPDPLVEQAIDALLVELGLYSPARSAGHRAKVRDFAARVLNPWEQLRRAVAESMGADVETWPTHGNAPLAIAAHVAVLKLERDELSAANADLILQRDKAERQRSEALTQQDTRLEFCRKERDALREALKGMLLSMDADWELLPAGGHDWPEACERARAALSGASSPATTTKENE